MYMQGRWSEDLVDLISLLTVLNSWGAFEHKTIEPRLLLYQDVIRKKWEG